MRPRICMHVSLCLSRLAWGIGECVDCLSSPLAKEAEKRAHFPLSSRLSAPCFLYERGRGKKPCRRDKHPSFAGLFHTFPLSVSPLRKKSSHTSSFWCVYLSDSPFPPSSIYPHHHPLYLRLLHYHHQIHLFWLSVSLCVHLKKIRPPVSALLMSKFRFAV